MEVGEPSPAAKKTERCCFSVGVIVLEKSVYAPVSLIIHKTAARDSGVKPVRHFGFPMVNLLKSVGYVEIHAVESITGNLGPDAVFLDWDLVDLDVVDFELA